MARRRHGLGFRWVHVAVDERAPLDVTILVAIASRADLDRFMSAEHDALATAMPELYEALEVRILDAADSAASGDRHGTVDPEVG